MVQDGELLKGKEMVYSKEGGMENRAETKKIHILILIFDIAIMSLYWNTDLKMFSI